MNKPLHSYRSTVNNSIDIDYELFFDMTPDLLCIAGYDGYFKKINPAVSKLLGYSEAELFSRPINDFVYPDDRDDTIRSRTNVIKGNPLRNFENRYVSKDGEIIWLSWTSMPVDSKKLVFAVAKNVTHKKRLEAERITLLETLTKVNKELKQLTLTTSHDLRSPLGNLLLVFEMLDVSKISDEETLQLIEILKISGDNLKNTLDNYVDVLSEKFTEQVQLEEIDLQSTLDEVLLSIDSLIKTSRATIHVDFSRLPAIPYNKAYMVSIFLNLISNSIKYAKTDCPAIINIYSERIDGGGCLLVEDNGLGFDLDKVKGKLFKMNQTFHNYRDSKGIGLYLVHSYVTSLGGSIHVESKVNEGSKFVIRFNQTD
ncbi:MAG: PAS domain-containing sensor histidine kinase [Balneolales bacterium]